ncbi:hypothetical protein F5050DRAFT_1708268 [Lentinula boryana]|uniref:Uncharacterized protein n=1 Tax=Lentinula boryana TaxID=40481 RepID=A0ABQ8QSL2_9AGAR|nr:hypothetical protein F5050DRAFT_1708268 [Lentinula boryana]
MSRTGLHYLGVKPVTLSLELNLLLLIDPGKQLAFKNESETLSSRHSFVIARVQMKAILQARNAIWDELRFPRGDYEIALFDQVLRNLARMAETRTQVTALKWENKFQWEKRS